MRVNNIDVGAAASFVEEVKKDGSKAVKVKKVEGEWVFEDGKPQFKAVLQHGEKSTTVEADGPPFLGGSALKPDPVQYCLFGLAACFAQTFASICAEQGIILKKLRVSAENCVNLTKALGIGDIPIVEKASISVEVESDSPGKMQEIISLSKERCPGVYCLTHAIPLEVKLK